MEAVIRSHALCHLLDFKTRRCGVRISKLAKLGECAVFVGQRESIHAPHFRSRVKLRGPNESAVDVKTVALSNPHDFVTNARLRTATPNLSVNCSVADSGDLPILKSV